jgi:hypothetical protein
LVFYLFYLETSGVSFVWLTKPPPRFGENSEINNTNVKYYSNQDQENNPEMTSKSNEEAPGKPIGNGYSDGR